MAQASLWQQHPALVNEQSEEDPHFTLPGMREALTALPRSHMFARPHTSPAGSLASGRPYSSSNRTSAASAFTRSGSTARRRSSLDAAARPLSREGPQDAASSPVLRGVRAMMSHQPESSSHRRSSSRASPLSGSLRERSGTDPSHLSSVDGAFSSVTGGRHSGGSLLSSVNDRPSQW